MLAIIIAEEFMKNIRALCDEKDILLILDEIQCGMGIRHFIKHADTFVDKLF